MDIPHHELLALAQAFVLQATPIIREQERLIEKELVTASVLTDVDEHGRIVPFDDYRLPGPIRVAFLVGAVLLGCAVFWLSVIVWITLTSS